MDRLARAARTLLHGSAALLFIGMVGLVLAQVVARKFFEPLVWSEELARYVFIWVAFLGWVIASERGSHVAVNLWTDRAAPAVARALRLLADAGTLVLMGLLLWQGIRLVNNNLDIEAVAVPVTMAVVYGAVPLAALAILLLTLARLPARWRGEALDHATEKLS